MNEHNSLEKQPIVHKSKIKKYPKNFMTAAMLSLFLGALGIDRYYLEKYIT